jgi:hypothetical protein
MTDCATDQVNDSEEYPRITPSGTSHRSVTGRMTPLMASFSV